MFAKPDRIQTPEMSSDSALVYLKKLVFLFIIPNFRPPVENNWI